MLSTRYKPWHIPLFLGKYAYLRARRRPVLLNVEVTMRCNARCGFCDYWKTPAESKQHELSSYSDAVRFFNPMLVTFTGGEPTLRRDLEDIVRATRSVVRLTYVQLITHGAMLSVDRARSLWDAGVDQFNISLDYLDERHDIARGIPGLAARILETVPKMIEAGIGGIKFNTVIKNDNLEDVVRIAEMADRLGAGVNFSVYTDFKNGNRDHLIAADTSQLDETIRLLLAHKQKRRGVISNSDHYLEQIPRWVRGELTEACRSGIDTVHIDPRGFVRRCPDFPADVPWQEYKRYEPINCDACFYACRGEAQAPLRLVSRVRDVLA